MKSKKWVLNTTTILVNLLKLYGIAVATSFLASLLHIPNQATESAIEKISFSPLYVLVPVFLVPIVEELLFRKIILQFLIKHTVNKSFSVIASSLIFAISHLDLFFLPYFLNGIVYSRLYLKKDSLIFPIIVHSLYNLTTVLLIYFLK